VSIEGSSRPSRGPGHATSRVAVWQDRRSVPAAATATPIRRQSRAARLRDLLTVLVLSDLRIRYGRGPLRALKWLLDPFAVVGVYLLLVALVLNRGGRAPGLSLACAVVPFQLVMMSVVNALRAIELRRAIILNLSFPRLLIPIAGTLTESLAFGARQVLLAIMMGIYGVAPTVDVLWLPVALALTVLLAAALAYPAALLGLWFPESQLLLVSMVRTLFFIAPGLVALDQVGGRTRELLPINPLTGLFESYRDALLFGRAPAAWELLVPLGVAAALLAIGVPLFRREQAHFGKLVIG
jgi:ABC-type polysaccharide/polyol phosphate export permease